MLLFPIDADDNGEWLRALRKFGLTSELSDLSLKEIKKNRRVLKIGS
jgi:hypothetical protein